MYDYVIIGTGPAGLTLAWYLAKYNKKILLVEKESSIGGCHRVRRVNGLFSEHGPRIYINNYYSLIDVLSDMGLKFDDLYTKYNYSTNVSINQLLSLLNWKEMAAFVYEFIKFCFSETPSRTVTMQEFTTKYNFSAKTTNYIGTICTLTDGGTIDNYTLYEFLQIFNQNALYDTYQPKLPNDVGLFKSWLNGLLKTGNVDIFYNTEIVSINDSKGANEIYILAKKNSFAFNIKAKRYIFAIPPNPMLKIIKNSTRDLFGKFDDLIKWEKDSRYLVYIPINFHFDSKVNITPVPGITASDYGIVYVVMSDYMNFNDKRSQTVVTCTVKTTDKVSKFNNKTANECNKSELISEVFRQLKMHQPHLPNPTYSILSPGIYKNQKNGKWETVDTAYFYTKAGYKSNKSKYNNLWWVGTHNGNSNYSFTSMESAMENAISLLRELEPQSKTVKIHNSFTVKLFILIVIIVVVLIAWLLFSYKYTHIL